MCRTTTGINPYCTLVGIDDWRLNYDPVFGYLVTTTAIFSDLPTNQDGILSISDDVTKITYPNGDGTTNGKFAIV